MTVADDGVGSCHTNKLHTHRHGESMSNPVLLRRKELLW